MYCTPKVRQVNYPQPGREELGMAKMRGVKNKGIAFWRGAVERLEQGESAQAVAEDLGVDVRGLQRWQQRLRSQKGEGSPERPREAGLAREVEKLKRALADKVLEVDFLRGALHKVEGRRQRRDKAGAQASTTKSGK
jgi:transposase-like protein